MKLSKFSIRGHAYEKLDYIALLQHLFLDVDLGDKHLHSLTLSVRDGNGDLFHFNGFPLEFDLKIDWPYIKCLHRTWRQVHCLNNSIRSCRLTTFGCLESVKIQKEIPGEIENNRKEKSKLKKSSNCHALCSRRFGLSLGRSFGLWHCLEPYGSWNHCWRTPRRGGCFLRGWQVFARNSA